MKCTKCNHALPDDSEFCQYCGNRIEKTAVMPEVDATIVVDEVTTASDVPVKNDVEASVSGETPKQSAEEVILLPEFENMEPDEAPKPILSVHEQETIATMNANCQSQAAHESEMDFGLVPEKARKAKKVKQPKKKCCSRSGSLVDYQSKQCTGCSKKYFKGIRFNKFTVTIVSFLLVISASVVLNVYQYMDNQELHDQVGKLESRIKGAQASIERLVGEKEDLRDQYQEYSMERFFFHTNAEIVGDDGSNLYHKYGCEKLDRHNGCWIFNTEAAESQGYIECPYCH